MPDLPTEPARDTIVAIATPPGRGGIGILRVSGPLSTAIASLLIEEPGTFVPQRARFCHLRDPATGSRLDEAIVTYFRGPRSYTGEDVVEIAAHGAPVLLDHLLRLLIQAGARLAEPGEFTERAFLSGRLDLTQAEAVRDLVDAQTLLQAQVAAQQLGGSLSRLVAPIKQQLVSLIATLEAGIDFAEDDTPVIADAILAARLDSLAASLADLERSFSRGRILTQGVTLAIVGRPNAGKSSLFNRLLVRDRAIVTAEPGTTRDTVHERLSLDGIPLELVDTAGLREAAGEAERIGIEKSREALADAGLVLVVLDCTLPLNEEEEALLRNAAHRRLLIVLNKSDLLVGSSGPSGENAVNTGLVSAPAYAQIRALASDAPLLLTSALTGDGFDVLRQAMQSILLGEGAISADSAMLTNVRQHQSVLQACAAMERSREAIREQTPHEMLLLDLYSALHALDALTGQTTADDVVNLIFSTFCIGK